MELKEQLEALSLKLEGKSKEQIKADLTAFEEKNNELIETSIKSVREELAAEMKAIQEHADALDVKLQEKKKQALIERKARLEAQKRKRDSIRNNK